MSTKAGELQDVSATPLGMSPVVSTTAAVLASNDDGGDEAIDCTPLQVHPLGGGRIVIIELCFRLDGSTFVRERVVFEEDTLPPDWFKPALHVTLPTKRKAATKIPLTLTPALFPII